MALMGWQCLFTCEFLSCYHQSHIQGKAAYSFISTATQFQSLTIRLGHKSGHTTNFIPVSHSKAHSHRAKAAPLITTSPDAPQWHPNNEKHRNNAADFLERVHWRLHLSAGRVSSGERRREAENATCFNLSKQRCCIAFFLSIVCERPGRREVLAFCAAFVPWPAEWPSGKPEWAGGGAISSIRCHSVSSTGVYFLFICRMRDMDTSLYLLSSSRSSHSWVLCLCFLPPFSKLTSSHVHMKAPQICFCFLLLFEKTKIWDFNVM